MISPQWLLGFSLFLFALAWIAILVRRNLIVMLMGVVWMFVSVALTFVGFARLHGPKAGGGEGEVAATGEAAAIVVLVLAIAYLVVGLAVVFSQTRRGSSPDVDDVSDLRW
jgi:NADH:ubiquinone oxidoreductase subunit K